jgi:hypothetical protein
MDLRENTRIFGLQEGGIIKPDDNTINDDIYRRNIPDIPLKPNLDVRSQETRHMIYPIMDTHKDNFMGPRYVEYFPEAAFAPINAKGPVRTHNSFFNLENELRGQNRPLHKGDLESINYVPSLNSTLYKMEIPIPSKTPPQPFPLLFSKPTFSPHLHENLINNDIGKQVFNNHTQQQMRNSV